MVTPVLGRSVAAGVRVEMTYSDYRSVTLDVPIVDDRQSAHLKLAGTLVDGSYSAAKGELVFSIACCTAFGTRRSCRPGRGGE